MAPPITSVGGGGGRLQGRHDIERVMAVDRRQALQDLAVDNYGISPQPNYGASVAGVFALKCFADGFAGGSAGVADIVKVFAKDLHCIVGMLLLMGCGEKDAKDKPQHSDTTHKTNNTNRHNT